MELVGKLFDGPVDIVGDVHGEIAALDSLLTQLGYDEHGEHPQGRRLVFVGDLVDSGPDSPAVLRRVRIMVNRGNAQCVLGNHELNLIRDEQRPGNAWWTAPDKDTRYPMARISAAEKETFRDWLETLPLVLERDDLRIVHACWNTDAIEKLRALNGPDYRVADLYDTYQREFYEEMAELRFMNQVKKEWARFAPRLDDPDWDAQFMPFKAELDRRSQMDNPISVVISGEQEVTDLPFFVGGKWRMCDRTKWWDGYDDDAVVVFGHYWRMLPGAAAALSKEFGPDLFEGIEPGQRMGPHRNAYCIDFSVAGRAKLGREGKDVSLCRLGALRFPEWQVVFENGETLEVS